MDNILTAFYGSPWAILPEKLEAIAEVVEMHARGERPSDDVLALYAAQNRKPQTQRTGKVAVLPLYGVLAQRMNMMTEMSGGTSYEMFAKQFQALVDDPEVSAIVIDTDSPGGEVAGVAEVADQVYAARGAKPIIAVANPLIASAAYRIASAADEVVAGIDTEIGSIGVFMVHTDRSQMDAKDGITRTLIKAGKYKAESLGIAPLTEEARAHMQAMVDDAYGQFVDAVAKYRGTTPEAVRDGYGQGRTQYGARAVRSGLADRVGTLASVLNELTGASPRVLRIAAAEKREPIAATATANGLTIDFTALPTATLGDIVAHLRPTAGPLAEATEPTYAVGSRVRSLVDHMPGMKGKAGVVREANAGAPPYYAVQFDGEAMVHKWLAETEVEPESTTVDATAPPNHIATPVERIPTATAHPVAVSHPGIESPDVAAPNALATPTQPTAPKAEEIPVSEIPTAAPGAVTTPSISVQDRAPERGAEIAALCNMARVPERTTGYILSGKSVEDVRQELHAYAQELMAAPALPPRTQIENYEDGKHQFSLGRAIVAAANNNWREAGFEQSVSRDLERRIASQGVGGGTLRDGIRGTTFYFPTVRKLSDQEREARMQATAHIAGTASIGGNLVFTEYGGFIDLLRTRMVLLGMGATFLPGLVGNVAFPRQITAGTSSAVAEGTGGSDVAESNMTLDQVTLTPKTVMAHQRYSNQLLAQGVINIDTLIRNDLAAIQSRKVDLLGLHGVGSSNEPTGLYAAADVNTVTFSGGPTYPLVVDMESAVEADDADLAGLGYVFTPEIKGKAKQTPIFTNTGTPIWTGGVTDAEVNGYRAMASNQLSKTLVSGTFSDCHGAIYGAWPELLIGEWGGMAITVDPYTLAGQDQVRIIAREFFDVGVRHGQSFCKAIQLRNV